MKHQHLKDSTGKLIEHCQTEKFPHYRAMRYTMTAIWKCRDVNAFDFVHALRMHSTLVREYFPMHAIYNAFPILAETDFAEMIRNYVTSSSRRGAFDMIDGKLAPYMKDEGIAACLRGVRSVEVLSSANNIVVLRVRAKLPRKLAKSLRWSASAMADNVKQFQLTTLATVISNRIGVETGIPVIVSHCDDRIKIMPDFYQIMAAYERDVTMPNFGMSAQFSERRAAKTAALRWLRNKWGYPSSVFAATSGHEADAVIAEAREDGVDMIDALEDHFSESVRNEVNNICSEIESGFSPAGDEDEFVVEDGSVRHEADDSEEEEENEEEEEEDAT